MLPPPTAPPIEFAAECPSYQHAAQGTIDSTQSVGGVHIQHTMQSPRGIQSVKFCHSNGPNTVHQPARSPSKHTLLHSPGSLVVPRGEEEETLSHLKRVHTPHTNEADAYSQCHHNMPLYVHTMQQQTHSATPQPHHKPSVLRRNKERESTPSERGTTTQMAERDTKQNRAEREREHIAMAMDMVPPDTNVAEHRDTNKTKKGSKSKTHSVCVCVCVV
jgi:hypothetical protein